MLLTFSRDTFKEKILSGEKVHTFRADASKRWKVGMKIQFWRGNPRNVKSNPHQFMEGECLYVHDVIIERTMERESWPGYKVTMHHGDDVREYRNDSAALIARNDGLTPEEFLKWFLSEETMVVGRCIGWTPCPYTMHWGATGYMAFMNTMRTIDYDGYKVTFAADPLFDEPSWQKTQG